MQLGELAVGGRVAAPGRRRVDHVVVHQCAGMQQLQRGEQQQFVVVGVAAGDGPPAPVGEGRPESLPAGKHEFFEAGDQRLVVVADVGRLGSTAAQVAAQPIGHGAGQVGGRRCRRCCCLDAQLGTLSAQPGRGPQRAFSVECATTSGGLRPVAAGGGWTLPRPTPKHCWPSLMRSNRVTLNTVALELVPPNVEPGGRPPTRRCMRKPTRCCGSRPSPVCRGGSATS